MKRLLTLVTLLMLLGTMLIPAQVASAQSSGPDICAAAANGESIPGYEVTWGRGGSGNQVVLGDDGDNTLRGGSGHDILCGFGGDDTLIGNSGNDILVGGDGEDVLRGGSGNDTEIQDGATSGISVSVSFIPDGDECDPVVELRGFTPFTEYYIEGFAYYPDGDFYGSAEEGGDTDAQGSADEDFDSLEPDFFFEATVYIGGQEYETGRVEVSC